MWHWPRFFGGSNIPCIVLAMSYLENKVSSFAHSKVMEGSQNLKVSHVTLTMPT